MTFTSTVKNLLLRRGVGRFVLVPYRFKLAASYYSPRAGQILRWLVQSKEITNFSYELTPMSRRYLVSTVSLVARCPEKMVEQYLQEIDEDELLKKHISQLVKDSPYSAVTDSVVHVGRRSGWYAFVRALKPRVVVETGIDKGLGSCVLAAALLRNAEEGHPGHYYGTDIDPAAGYFFREPYTRVGKILYGDSIQSLQKLEHNIDLMINDSDHSAVYEAQEYRTVASKLSPVAVILGDNAHATDALCKFAQETGRKFIFFSEMPQAHWYPGGGIGIAFGSAGTTIPSL